MYSNIYIYTHIVLYQISTNQPFIALKKINSKIFHPRFRILIFQNQNLSLLIISGFTSDSGGTAKEIILLFCAETEHYQAGL